MSYAEEIQELKDIVRIGKVSSINETAMTARVKFEEMGIVSGNLKIVSNTPEVTLEKQASEDNGASLLSDSGESEEGGVTQIIQIIQCPGCTIKVEPWKPKIGQWVLCLLIPKGDGDGFIIGGI